MDNEIDRKINGTAKLFLLVHNRQQKPDWTLIESGANGLGIQEWREATRIPKSIPNSPNYTHDALAHNKVLGSLDNVIFPSMFITSLMPPWNE